MKPTLEGIWDQFAAKLGQFIAARLADPATAEDILQDVFLKIQSRLDSLQDPAKLQAWLYLVPRNAIIDHYRTRKDTMEVPESLPAEAPPHDADRGGTSTNRPPTQGRLGPTNGTGNLQSSLP